MGFVLSAFADEIAPDLSVQMDVLSEHDIAHIEMRGVNGRNITEYSLSEAEEIKKQLDRRGFKLSAIGSPIGKIFITDDFAPHLELFKHTLDLADVLEAPYIRMFSFFIPEGAAADDFRQEVLGRWQQFINAADGRGIILLHENEKQIYGDTPERCLDLLDSLDCDFVRAIFDPANFIQCDVETYPHAFHLLKKYVVYMHIKDALRTNHQVVPSGMGDGRLPEILQELKDDGFDGFLSLEPHLGSFQGLDQLELDDISKKLPEGGPRQFSAAAQALRKVLGQLK